MTALNDIERIAKLYADKRLTLRDRVGEFEEAVRELKRQHLRGIRTAMTAAAQAEDRLRIAIEDAPEAFKRPRSQVLHGIRCGYQQNAGRLEWDNPNRVCDLIRKHFAEDESALIRTSETPNRKGLAERSAADLKRLGVRIVGAGDQVLIKPVDSELERMVDALLQEAREEGDQAA